MVPLKVELLAGENIVQVIDLGITGMLLASVALTFSLRSSPVSHLYYCTFFLHAIMSESSGAIFLDSFYHIPPLIFKR